MITVKDDYEPIIYELPFNSHIYENQLELLKNYYTTPISNNVPVEQEVHRINTVIKPQKRRSTNHIYQNIQKEQQREKIWTIPFLLESPKNKKNFNHRIIKIDFLFDSGAESNIINIPTWNKIKTLHPILTTIKTASKIATAQGSTLVKYGINFSLFPLEQWNKIKY